MSLDATLCRLLFERPFREAFLRGDADLLSSLAPVEIDALSGIDLEQLVRASRLACDGILRRSHRGTGSLLDVFPETVAAWRCAHPGEGLEALADALTSSTHFALYRALPTCDDGISLEEVFFRFAEESSIGDTATRQMECATALLKTLALTRSPSFSLPSFIHQARDGYFAVIGDQDPLLIAAVGEKFIRGPITQEMAEQFRLGLVA